MTFHWPGNAGLVRQAAQLVVPRAGLHQPGDNLFFVAGYLRLAAKILG
jgi:hypothetical protein